MADTPARLSASEVFTESFFGTVPNPQKSLNRNTTGWSIQPREPAE
jgi:hypothetical protein